MRTQEEILALWWAIETCIPLATPQPHPWMLVSYEKLVLNGEPEIRQMLSELSLAIPSDLNKLIERPSARTWRKDRKRKGPMERIAAWKKRLNEKQVKLILAITHAVGLDCYTTDTEPDYKRLYGIHATQLEKILKKA